MTGMPAVGRSAARGRADASDRWCVPPGFTPERWLMRSRRGMDRGADREPRALRCRADYRSSPSPSARSCSRRRTRTRRRSTMGPVCCGQCSTATRATHRDSAARKRRRATRPRASASCPISAISLALGSAVPASIPPMRAAARPVHPGPGEEANPPAGQVGPARTLPGAAPVVVTPVPIAPPPADTVVPPRQLQPAGAPIPGRVYNPLRPGAPPLAPDLVGATIATTPPSRRQPPEERPFDPLGIQVGAFNVRPAFEYTRGYDTNAPRNSTAPAASSWFNLYAPELLINSNWARHELTVSAAWRLLHLRHQPPARPPDRGCQGQRPYRRCPRYPHRARRPLSPLHRQSWQPQHTSRSVASTNRHDVRRHRRARPSLQSFRCRAQGHLRPHCLQRLRSSPTAPPAAMPDATTIDMAASCAPATR